MERKLPHLILVDDDQDDISFFWDAIADSSLQNSLLSFDQSDNFLNEARGMDLPDNSLIFLDDNMPGKSGLECLADLQQLKNLKNVKIFIYSTFSFKERIDNAFSNHADLYIKKPNRFGDIGKIIKNALSTDWKKHAAERNRSNFYWDFTA